MWKKNVWYKQIYARYAKKKRRYHSISSYLKEIAKCRTLQTPSARTGILDNGTAYRGIRFYFSVGVYKQKESMVRENTIGINRVLVIRKTISSNLTYISLLGVNDKIL